MARINGEFQRAAERTREQREWRRSLVQPFLDALKRRTELRAAVFSPTLPTADVPELDILAAEWGRGAIYVAAFPLLTCGYAPLERAMRKLVETERSTETMAWRPSDESVLTEGRYQSTVAAQEVSIAIRDVLTALWDFVYEE